MGEGSDWWEVGLVRRHARAGGHPVHTAGSVFTGSPLSRGRQKLSCEDRAFLDAGALGPFAGADLAGIGLHTRDLETSVRADHRDAVRVDRDDLAELAGDAFRVL